jgi:hypothetical protein
MLDIDCECYFIKKNFHVDVALEELFESNHAPVVVVPPLPFHCDDNSTALNDIVPKNVRGGPGLIEHIVELYATGVEVDDDNEPLNEGDALPPPDKVRHRFEVPTYCPHHEWNLMDDKGKWVHHCWDKITSYTELELFWIAFPGDFVKRVILATMNDHLGSKLMLGEFYK